MIALYIGIAGALGSMCRYWMGSWVQGMVGARSQLPLGTLGVNVLGSLAMGVLVAVFASRGELDSRLRMALAVGFLGGFTTYSSFALETVGLLEQRNLHVAALYISLTLFTAGFACYLGLLLGRRL
ncbi:MAG: fluoride efflux transporter CrcB [Myxococcales bacterium]|nr:fluoride efflux transporter CrcB [Myxococcales bacterium]